MWCELSPNEVMTQFLVQLAWHRVQTSHWKCPSAPWPLTSHQLFTACHFNIIEDLWTVSVMRSLWENTGWNNEKEILEVYDVGGRNSCQCSLSLTPTYTQTRHVQSCLQLFAQRTSKTFMYLPLPSHTYTDCLQPESTVNTREIFARSPGAALAYQALLYGQGQLLQEV